MEETREKEHDNFYDLKKLYNFLDIVESSKIAKSIIDTFNARSPIGCVLYTEYCNYTQNIKNQINKLLNEEKK